MSVSLSAIYMLYLSFSDNEIVKKSDFLDKLTPGDEVMADKGFLVQDELAVNRHTSSFHPY